MGTLGLKSIVRDVLPPVIVRQLSRKSTHGWFGSFSNWEEAQACAGKYDNRVIFDKIRASALAVRDGFAAFERDSVLFNRSESSWPLLTTCLLAARKSDDNLSVIDFGGALGSAYFQHRKFLDEFSSVFWSVVELPDVVACGKQEFANGTLSFCDSISSSVEHKPANLGLFLSSLQYLQNPLEFIEEMKSSGVSYILVDRTPVSESGKERICVQRVSPEIYDASYPCWVFSEEKLVKMFSDTFSLISDFSSDIQDSEDVLFKGFLFKSNG